MRTADDRADLVPRMQAFDERVHREIEAEQVRHIDLADYQPGAPHYERLMHDLALVQAFQWPSMTEPV